MREFVRPALRAVPGCMARRLGSCVLWLGPLTDAHSASEWTESPAGLTVRVTPAGVEGHDVALEVLLCLGQALWARLSAAEIREYAILLEREFLDGVTGEIDEQALEQRRSLGTSRHSWQRTERYVRASFAGTAAEYVHCLWHHVTIRAGPDYLPAPQLRRRLELLNRWFPPDRGYRLFPHRRGVCS